jgi:hypothetical protein
MNGRNATGILAEQRPPVTATFHGSKERLSLLWIATTAFISWYAWKWSNTEVPA